MVPVRVPLVSSDVRRHNLALICQTLAAEGPLSRSEVAARTGITRGSLTALSSELLAAGVVAELEGPRGGVAVGRVGRPSTPLALVGEGRALLVVQLDADAATARLTSLSGVELWRAGARHGAGPHDPGPVMDVVAGVARAALAACRSLGRQVVDTTMVVFAPVGPEPGTVLANTDLGWGEVDVVAALRERVPGIGAAVALVSDAPAALRGEMGAMAASGDVVYIKSNSGIGGAAVSGGRPLTGARGFAAGFGHIAIVPGGPACACGQRGCLVTVAGPEAVLARAGLAALARGAGLEAALAEFCSRVLAGEPRAAGAWESALRWIVRALAILATCFNPDTILVGGYWADLAGSIARAWEAAIPAGSPAAALGVPALRPGVLGADASLIGATLQSRDRVLADAAALLAGSAATR